MKQTLDENYIKIILRIILTSNVCFIKNRTIAVHSYIRGFTKFGKKVLWRLQVLEYLRTLHLKFQKARTKIEVVLSLPCWLSQFSWDSQQGRGKKTSILVRAFYNFKLKVPKYPRSCRLHATLIPNLAKPPMYLHIFLTLQGRRMQSKYGWARVNRKSEIWNCKFCDFPLHAICSYKKCS